ncbi:hypothetical protein SAMN05444166_6501 [Singulisphaera sp. GP187]|uniref:hypothetical protein n=1 Tax=Singulisphaera sp. GP187 TaxID=1882752 RepID=UPI000929A7ED|nr:hypothetical protein [Singulisphaera sp. GP187]SIO60727.1 hypothetical protein SAMN05444166_6501 [Singulisphaera sp. GP187]
MSMQNYWVKRNSRSGHTLLGMGVDPRYQYSGGSKNVREDQDIRIHPVPGAFGSSRASEEPELLPT